MQPFTFKRTKKRAHTLPTRTCTSIRTCTYAHLHEHAHAHVQAHAPARTSAHARACTSAHAHEHVHMHTQHAHAQAHRAYDRIASLTLLGRFRRACGVTLSFVICLCKNLQKKKTKQNNFRFRMYYDVYFDIHVCHNNAYIHKTCLQNACTVIRRNRCAYHTQIQNNNFTTKNN